MEIFYLPINHLQIQTEKELISYKLVNHFLTKLLNQLYQQIIVKNKVLRNFITRRNT